MAIKVLAWTATMPWLAAAQAQLMLRTSTPAFPVVMAHRGCCMNGVGGFAPENTIAAFKYAYDAGAAMFETDLRFTTDGQIVIIHDATLDRTTNCSGPVSDWTLADIQNKCDAGSWLGPEFAGEKVPTLQDFLSFVASSGMSAVLDLKDHGLVPSIVAAAQATSGLDQAQLIASINFHEEISNVTALLRRSTIMLNPNINTPIPSNIKGVNGARYFGDLREAGVDVIFPNYLMKFPQPSLNELGVTAAKYGVQTWAWTLDTPHAWSAGAAAGIRVMCTNDPAGALASFKAQHECVATQCPFS